MKITTTTAIISQSPQYVFDFLSDFNNYSELMPPEITDWKAIAEHCTFKKDKFVNIGMQFQSKIPNNQIIICDYAKNAFPYTLTININEVDATNTSTQMIFEGDPNVFLKLVVEKPLTLFFNNLNQSLSRI